MVSEDDKKLLEILQNHIGNFDDFKKAVNEYHLQGYKSMIKIDELHQGHKQTLKYLANLEALPLIAEKFQSIKSELLPAAMAQNHVPVATMSEALKTQAKILGIIIGVLLTLVVSLLGAFVTIKVWFPQIFN